ncbi:SGNH/GDSL hydrolase family protein [Maribacter polysiphoniae]|uniref:GDSL-like lipase/acylhydrolase family protein n=1 Tax=Maribacter polysiphoniae TaxID=429344 RepID=A0A316E5S4_9FLAO|nr:SGNH/GDSL hydrolase family protein [Maribacter polysiphoniae]MBD1260813.1 SGNH/GDSL hydrolase family protein [Maribacter polysiphoniae]PWK24053.1 GDSL-like lipase/acylhydrolase family protein [Maribacter polysiphoniae]
MLARKRSIFVLMGLWVIAACSSTEKVQVVEYSHSKIQYEGRIDTTKSGAAVLYWSGTSIKMNFEGESIAAIMQDEEGDNYFNVIVDNEEPFILRPDTIKKSYPLASGLSKGKHTIEVFKRTEWDRGKTLFYGFNIAGSATVLPKPLPKKRKIEFYGNSITAGNAVEDTSGADLSDSTYTNNYRSYARLTAKHFDAEYRCICRSGIGITISWFPLTMPELYDRLDPEDPTSTWDFSKYTPDIVVINLMQNDSWLVGMPDHAEFKAKFGTQPPTEEFIVDAYAQFVRNIRKEYPKAHIVCMLGNMDVTDKGSKWPGYVERAVGAINDPKIYTHFVPYKNTPGHPNIAEQKELSQSLIQFIEGHIAW